MKKSILLKKSSNYYNSMDSIVNYIEKTFKTNIPNIFRFENPSYGFNVGEKTYITPDLSAKSADRFFIQEEVIDKFLETCSIVFVGVVGNKQDLYKNSGIYQSNVIIKNISLYGIQQDGTFVDLIRKLKFDTSHPDMVFYPLCSYVKFKTENALYCILNDELVTIETNDEAASIKTDYPYILVDPFTSTVKEEVLSFSCLDESVLISKNFVLLPKGKTEVNFNIFKPVYGSMFGPSASSLLDIKTNGIATISDNVLNIKTVDKYTVVKVVVNLHGLFAKSIKGERLEFDCVIVSG
jgi:hypothetical protein